MDLVMPGLGSIPSIITCTIEGFLDEDDLRELAMGGEVGDAGSSETSPAASIHDDPTDLKRIKERHHNVARLLAGGMDQRLVATLCNYTETYLSVLLNNPAMQELVLFYRTRSGAAVQVATEQLRSVGLKALEKINDKLDTEDVGITELTAVAKLGLDRAGLGPTQKSVAVTEHHVIDHAEIAKLNNEARKGSSSYIVPVEDVRRAALPAPTEENKDG